MEVMNCKETAEYLKVSYWHFMRLLHADKDHPPFFYIGRERRFIKSEVDKWARGQK